MRLAFGIFTVFLFMNVLGQQDSFSTVVSKFKSIKENPSPIFFENKLKINNKGGHLQGIQLIERKKQKYVIVSGSSDSYAWYSVIKQGKKNEVISVNKLMDKPYKHAGGFQIYENLMAVGIEDNDAKDKSKVCIYNVSDPESPSMKPLAVIERNGEIKRATAGCVGITKFMDEILVVVGDWDTKHLDFYSCNYGEVEKDKFEKIYSVDTEKLAKEDWINESWYPYQNINIFSNGNELHMVGLGKDEHDENIADLFQLTKSESDTFAFKKVASKSFYCTNENDFKAGAGIVLSETGEMKIISCGYNIKNKSCLNLFENQVYPAHAHNDYLHTRPLFDALSCNFKSIEADVFSVGDSLFVAHNFEDIKPGRTLRNLYLEPLAVQIKKNGGSVYENGEEIILFIDIKDDGLKTYQLLHQILSDYKDEVSVFKNGIKTPKSILVVVSGNRPFSFMESQNERFAAYDGRLNELDSQISSTLMPVVSDNWARKFTWNGVGEFPAAEKDKLQMWAKEAKSKGYILRFWGTPNRTQKQRWAVWKELSNAGVGLIGADNLNELKNFFDNWQ